jgi:exopolyphosphatase/guanosine-5'-triphosphate,3'-diphosphate pyrophosphatase
MVGVVDIGTNSMRLLITDGEADFGRWVEVTGLGRGVDSSGSLAEETVEATVHVLEKYGRIMDEHEVGKRLAIATSASRDATNRETFFDRAETALGVRPTLISGETEGRYAFSGAIGDLELEPPVVVTDIGGGSTEFVTADLVRSVDVGTVRLADRALPGRPPTRDELEKARSIVNEALAGVEAGDVGSHIGVAGTWTSLSAIALGLDRYDRDVVHGSRLSVDSLADLVARLSAMTMDETRRIPGLDPKRAPVILPGAVIARAVMETLSVTETIVSERDTLDGAAMELIGIA